MRKVHLVGSVPLENADAVFDALGSHLGERLARYPDGETGARKNWTRWQVHAFEHNPSFARSENGRFVLLKNREPALGALGYAQVARQSYESFVRLRENGIIPAASRFLVSIPTPVAIAYTLIDPADVERVEEILFAQMQEELCTLADAIPANDLSVQWDCAIEPIVLAGGWPDFVHGMRAHCLKRVPALIDLVPAEADVGVHLCYGDPGHKHIIEPQSLGLSVELANAFVAGANRRIDWIHMPVPRERSDDDYFAPLKELAVSPGSELFLGLVHFTDGAAGARARIAAASKYADAFGIATECGLGRRKPETILPLLELHARIADERFE